MKKLILLLTFLFCAIISFAQFPNNQSISSAQTLYHAKGGLKGDISLILPVVDTLNNIATPYVGALTIRPQDTLATLTPPVYASNGHWWYRLSSNISFAGLVDSVIVTGNIICVYYTTGVVKCYTLQGGNCVSHVESGSVIYDSLLVFHSTVFNYFIGCRNFTAPATDFTLDPAYVTAPRIDVWIVDTFGTIRVVKGDSSGLKYQYNPLSEFEVASAVIGANATTPTNITNVAIYKENVEWVGSSDVPGALFNYATNPYAGLLSTYVPSFINLSFVQYTDNTTHDISSVSFLDYRLRLDAAMSSGNINITFYLGAVPITNPVSVFDGLYGFNASTVGSYQLNAIPSSAIVLNGNGTDFDAVRFTFSGTGGTLQFDNVILQSGGGGTGATGVITFAGGDGSPPRNGNVIFRQTDDIWSYQSSQFNSDTSYEYHYNNITRFIDSTWVPKTPIVARNGITIKDTAINGIAAKIFIGSGSGTVTDTSFTWSVLAILNTPASTPDTGAIYLVGTSPTGVFVGHANEIATWDGTIYTFEVPAEGDLLYDVFTDLVYTWNGTAWVLVGKAALHQGGDTYGAPITWGSLDYHPLIGKANNVRSIAIGDSTTTNTSVGFGALRNIPLTKMSANSISESNTAIGYKSIGNITTGSNNTGVGTNSLGNVTSGVGNIGMGTQALFNTTTGYYNTAVGSEAMYSNTLGFYNAAFGYQSLFANTNSQWNVAMGYLSLRSNTTGNYNTAIGAEALRTNVTGSASTAVGLWSLYSNTSGNNTAVGTQSLYATTTGSLNSAFGYHALEKTVTGSRNIAMGHDAAHLIADSVSFATTINDGVYLGYKTKTLTATETNAMVFGAFAQSEGSNKIVLGNKQHLNTRFYGIIRDSTYGTGAITGTPTYNLAVDATGKVIEVTGGGSTPTLQDALDASITAADNPIMNAHGNDFTLDSANTFSVNARNYTYIQSFNDTAAVRIIAETDTSPAIYQQQTEITTGGQTTLNDYTNDGAKFEFTKAINSVNVNTEVFIRNADTLGSPPVNVWVEDAGQLKLYPFASFGGGGGVTSVSGTTDRITSTGGTTPVIDISATFEGLLLKKTDSTIYQPKFRSDTARTNIYTSLAGKQAAGNYAIADSTVWQTKFRTDSARTNIYTSLASKLSTATAASTYLPLAGGTMVGNILATDNTYDLGASGATRFRTAYLGTSLMVPAINGGSAANDDITIQGTTNATRTTSYVLLQPTAGKVGIGTSTPTANLHINESINGLNTLLVSNPNTSALAQAVIQANSASTVFYFAAVNGNYAGYGAITAQDGYAYSSNGLTLMADHATTGIIRFATGGAPEKMRLDASGRLGIGVTGPTAVLHLKAGTATASTSPIKLTAGVVTTTPVSGQVETDAVNDLYYTNSGAVRSRVGMWSYKAITATYPITNSDYTLEATSGTFTATLPTAVGISGRVYIITNSGAGVVTIATTSSETFVNVVATPTTLTLAQFNTVTLQSNGAAWLRLTNL